MSILIVISPACPPAQVTFAHFPLPSDTADSVVDCPLLSQLTGVSGVGSELTSNSRNGNGNIESDNIVFNGSPSGFPL